MSLQNLLQYLLKENIDEVAKSISDAQSSGLALFRENEYVVLFEPAAFYAEMDSLFGDKALEKNFAQFQIELEKMKAIITDPLSLELYTGQLKRLNEKIPMLITSPDVGRKKLAAEINDSLKYIESTHYGVFKYKAAKLRNNPSERFKLNKEKEEFERLYNKIVEGVFLISDPTYGDRNKSDILRNALFKCIRGYIGYSHSSICSKNGPDTYEVNYSAAQKGWGPLTYDITMSLINPGYLIADRGSNSSDADKVWMYYLKNRPDVHKELIEEILTGDCDLPTSTNPVLKKKLTRAQRLIIQSKEETKPSYEDEDEEPQPVDQNRLADVIEEIKKVLADVPQAWRYQISQPLSTATLDNAYNLFIDQVFNRYGIEVTAKNIRSAASWYFDVNYSPGD